MRMHMSSRPVGRAAAGLLLAVCAAVPPAGADGGLYAGFALGRERLGADYAKGVGLDFPPSFEESADRAVDFADTVKAFAGYRLPLPGMLYVAAGVEAALSFDEGVAGFVEGTGDGDRDVWPGLWEFRRDRSLGVEAKVGIVPPMLGFLGPGGSLYAFAGKRWFDGETVTGHVNETRGTSGARSRDVSPAPWLFGAGVEFGGPLGRFDLRLSHASYAIDLDFGTGAAGNPRIGYDFDIREWGLFLGYSILFGD